MPLVLVISSFVAGSRVGGGLAPFVLGPMKVDPVHVPTCLFGRHPGWGDPGGAPVDPAVMAGMLEGIEANGLYSVIDAVVTGHFSHPEQVAVACEAIDRIRAAERMAAHRHAPARPIVIVDPVMGDSAKGLYVREETAEALARDLVPRAEIIAPNLWEFALLTGVPYGSLETADDVARAAKATREKWLISSVPSSRGIGVLHVDGANAMLVETPRVEGDVPKGTGDLLTLRFAGGLVSGLGAEGALADATGATYLVVAKSVEWEGAELSIAACSDLLVDPPRPPVRLIV
jgi:pyridoxine kinase